MLISEQSTTETASAQTMMQAQQALQMEQMISTISLPACLHKMEQARHDRIGKLHRLQARNQNRSSACRINIWE